MEEKEEVVVNNVEQQKEKVGLSIAAMVLGIVSLVLWCYWPISIACGIVAIVFGILRMKVKAGKGMAIAGFVTGMIAAASWLILFALAFLGGFVSAL